MNTIPNHDWPEYPVLLTRTRIEEREQRILAPYAALACRSLGRLHPEPEHEFRTCFQRDRDRIIHATAFRRLEYKTQVFINKAGDHYRTRLTHTLEVAQIARTLARLLGLNEDLAESIALAHDLGHPPFGHAGERMLNNLMESFGGFEHNFHALRIVDLLEKRYPDFPGLNLTAETRRGLLKKKHAPLASLPGLAPLLSLEAQIVDLCDLISYTTHDLDDGIESELLDDSAFLEVALWREAAEHVASRHPDLSGKRRRYQMLIRLINSQVMDAAHETLRRLQQSHADSPEETVCFSPSMAKKIQEACAFLAERFYHHPLVLRTFSRCDMMIQHLFEHYLRHPDQLPRSFQDRIPHEGLQRSVADYLAGMTDRYAEEDCKNLFGF